MRPCSRTRTVELNVILSWPGFGPASIKVVGQHSPGFPGSYWEPSDPDEFNITKAVVADTGKDITDVLVEAMEANQTLNDQIYYLVEETVRESEQEAMERFRQELMDEEWYAVHSADE